MTYNDIERRLAALSAVQSVGATSHLPLTGQDARAGIVVEGREPTDGSPTRAHLRAITPGYFRSMGMRLITGRNFTTAEDGNTPFVAIVNETMAKRYWPGASAIGKRVRFTDQEVWREVVGIIGDVKHWGLDAPVNPELYVPSSQFPTFAQTFVLLTDGNPLALVPLVQRHVRDLDPNLPLFQVRTMEEVAASSVERRKWTMSLLAVFAGLALALAAAGIYGVMSHLVSLRTPEIGVRLTLGARPFAVMRQVLGEGVLQAAIGLALGLGASFAVMNGMRTILFGVEPTDPLTLVSVGVSLMLVALLAVTVPALRAMRVDPVLALRAQ
jgi:putative ABC transport system permease protein